MRASTALAVGAGLLAAGLTAGVLVAPDGPYLGEDGAGTAEGPRTVPVVTTTTTDPVPLSLEAQVDDPHVAAAPSSGTVTRSWCAPGAVLSSGDVVMEIDEKRIGVLATTVPLWRDLTVGTEGRDVRAVTEELARLGADIETVSTLDLATARRVQAFLEEKGFDLGTGPLWGGRVVVPRDQVTWLPVRDLPVVECPLRLGSAVSAGETLASGSPTVVALRAVTRPAGSVAGTRVVEVADVRVPLPDDGMVVDPDDVAALLATPVGVELVRAGFEGPLAARYVLDEPIDVVAVPPAALVDPGGRPCLLSPQGEVVDVAVVTTSLGQVMVRPADGADVPEAVRLDPAGTASCR